MSQTVFFDHENTVLNNGFHSSQPKAHFPYKP